jgi:putative nucleotidyltransferase with HDIG domain
MAGGALVGSFSEKGLNLDIGGQTTEVVENILHGESIPIYKSETDGCLGCCLSLNLQTWKSEIRPIGTETVSAVTVFKKPTAEQLEQSIQQARPIPQIALKALRMIREPKHSLEDVAQEIRQDQVISARVLKLCNSAFFGLRTKIESIDRALVLVGERRFLQLVISLSLKGFFPQAEQGYSLCKGGLYNHALGTAVFAETLAQFTGKVAADIAYTGGLLHDIGKALLDQYVAPAYPLFYQRIQVDGADLIAVERDAFGVSHTEIGAQLAEHWSLPESLIDTIGYHHQPEQATANPELTHLVYLTDLLLSRFLVGQELERLNTDGFVLRLERIGLSPSDLPILVDLIPQRVFEGSLLG